MHQFQFEERTRSSAIRDKASPSGSGSIWFSAGALFLPSLSSVPPSRSACSLQRGINFIEFTSCNLRLDYCFELVTRLSPSFERSN